MDERIMERWRDGGMMEGYRKRWIDGRMDRQTKGWRGKS